MCDKEAFHRLEDRVDNLELKQCKCETATATKFEAFEKTTKLLIMGFKWVFVSLFMVVLILVFTVVYGAIGERGLHSVQHAVQETVH